MARRRGPEVLAPAGSFDSMKAAVAAGADGVYIGGSRFGARAYADNPDQDQLLEAIDYAHLHGVSLYMTVNTLMKEQEMEKLYDFLAPYYERGVDGVIVQDLGAVSCIRQWFPDLPVHGSTQMTVTGVYGARILERLGVKRVVTAREMSLEEIERIHREVPIEIESFVHGALCYCYSGQCLLSSFIGGRSGNRGRCAQPCRLAYSVTSEEREDRRLAGTDKKLSGKKGQKGGTRDDNYILSMKDLCTLDIIPDIIDAGICSLKIEGRMKSPRYTAGVVHVYRKYVDMYLADGRKGYKVDPADRQMLLDLFDRGGFTQGYYRQHNGADMIARKEKPGFRQANQELFDRLDKLYVETEKKEPVTGCLTVKEGEPLRLKLRMVPGEESPGRNQGMCFGGTDFPGLKENPDQAESGGAFRKMGECPAIDAIEVEVLGARVEKAENQPAVREKLEKQIRKTGGTPFVFRQLETELEGEVFVPVQALNELRRNGLEALKEAVLQPYRRRAAQGQADSSRRDWGGQEGSVQVRERAKPAMASQSPKLHVLLPDSSALSQIIEVSQVREITIESDGVEAERWPEIVRLCREHGKSCVLAMPVIFRRHGETYFDKRISWLQKAEFDGILVRSLEEIEYLRARGIKLPLYGDHNLYVFNQRAGEMMSQLGCDRVTLPLELNGRELSGLDVGRRELIVYGFLPAMVSAQCVKKTVSGCTRTPQWLMMKDRTGKELPVRNHCSFCYNIIYNPDPLSLMNQLERIEKLAPESVRLCFTKESALDTERITRAWARALAGEEKPEADRGEFTRGHFKRGVE